jgi:hypothetical protein
VAALFQNGPLTLQQWGIALGFSLIPVTACECRKLVYRVWFND